MTDFVGGDVGDFDVSILFNIDVSERTVPRLSLEELESIDWELVASATLGVADPIGQLREWLASVLAGFVDVLKNFFSALVSPIASAVSQIWSVVSQIPSALSSLISALQNIVLDPVRNLISFAIDAFGRLRDAFSTIINAVSTVFNTLQERARELLSTIANALSEIPNRISEIARSISDALGQIPRAVSDIVASLTRAFNDVRATVSSMVSELANRIAQIPSALAEAVNRIASMLGELGNRVRDAASAIASAVSDALGRIQSAVSNFGSALLNALNTVATNAVNTIGGYLRTLADNVAKFGSTLADSLARVASSISNVINELTSRIREGMSAILGALSDAFVKIRDMFGQVAVSISNAMGELVARTRDAIASLSGAVGEAFAHTREVVESIIGQIIGLGETAAGIVRTAFGEIAKWIQEATKILHGIGAAFQGFMNAVLSLPRELWNLLPNEIRSAFIAIYNFFTQTVPKFFIEDIPNFFRQAVKFFTQDVPRFFTETLPQKLQEFAQWVWNQLPQWFRDALTAVYDFFTKTAPKFLTEDIPEFFRNARQFFESAIDFIKNLPDKLKDLGRRIWENIPEPLKKFGELIRGMFDKLKEELTEFFKDPGKYIWERLVTPMWNAVKYVGGVLGEFLGRVYELLANAFKTALGVVASAVASVASAVMDIASGVFKTFSKVADYGWNIIASVFNIRLVGNSEFIMEEWNKWSKEIEDIFQTGYMRAEGIGNQMWWAGAQLIVPFWRATLLAYLLKGLVNTFYDYEIVWEPQVAGSKLAGVKWRINMAELFGSLLEGLPAFAHAFAIGSSFALSQLYLQNVQHLYTPRAIQFYEKVKDKLIGDVAKVFGYDNAIYNFFIMPPSVDDMVEWGRRWVAVIKGRNPEAGVATKAEGLGAEMRVNSMSQVLDTIKLYMLYHGLPRWYIEYLAQDPEKFAIEFKDRFGMIRRLSLSPLYELPTHSEMARMTQRDIFPGVDVMKALGWVRGWPEDLTTMMYLLTFKYPSFEKLWEFYMRATAGMLWFKAPDVAKSVFAKEAQEIGAGAPVDPLTIQRALASRGAAGMSAIELALNTYLKWLEYSNFSWFTEKTTMYGINVGQQIISALGGWVADSWLMWDVAADIPGKIDMRWMSRYGIFQLMAERIGEQFFTSYTPMVDVIGKVMDPEPRSKITVELHWFSKLLQSTGLHPAWVPVTTVAENIMVIADEMTLLRTGWLNLFRDGLITHDVMDQSLAGLFTVAYKVGFWNPDTKQWTTGWVNLPVRWLPHERKLLEYRALIDRVVLLYRRLHGYLQSAVRAMVVRPEEARAMMLEFAKMLDAHYAKIGKEITGFDVRLNIDTEFIDLWYHTVEKLGYYEAYKRARRWWERVSGWLLYRIAQGYVDEHDVVQLVNEIREVAKLTDIEVVAYYRLARALFGAVVAKERVPTPWQLATLAEYMHVPADLIAKSIETHKIADEFRNMLAKYIYVKPLKSDYRSVITDAMRLYRIGRISKETLDAIIEGAKNYGFTEPEIQLLKLRGELLSLLVDTEAKSLRVPTPWQLATLAEYMTVPAELVAKSIEEYGVDTAYAPFVARYILMRPLKSDYKSVISQAVRALRYGAITKDTFDMLLRNALNYGFTETEISLVRMATELALAVEETREYVPSPTMLATLAEYIPEVRNYIKHVFETKKIRGVWADMWAKYIYLRPVVDEVRRWASAMYALIESGIVPLSALGDVFRVLSTYGYEELERAIITRTVMAHAARRAWAELLGSARQLATMSRYSDVAMDMAWSRVQRIIDLLPVDNNTKEAIKTMWRQYITHYQNYPEIRSYVTELVAAYAYGVLSDIDLERELNYLKQLGVTDVTIALIRRRAKLRRIRYAVMSGR